MHRTPLRCPSVIFYTPHFTLIVFPLSSSSSFNSYIMFHALPYCSKNNIGSKISYWLSILPSTCFFRDSPKISSHKYALAQIAASLERPLTYHLANSLALYEVNIHLPFIHNELKRQYHENASILLIHNCFILSYIPYYPIISFITYFDYSTVSTDYYSLVYISQPRFAQQTK
jgi:hypothetical protein